MDAKEFLDEMGWPKDRQDEAGQARWTGMGADGLSQVVATISRDSQRIVAKIDSVGLDGSESLLALEASVEGAVATVSRSQAGEPPESMPAEDAVALFKFMSSGLGRFKFDSTGPLRLGSAPKPA